MSDSSSSLDSQSGSTRSAPVSLAETTASSTGEVSTPASSSDDSDRRDNSTIESNGPSRQRRANVMLDTTAGAATDNSVVPAVTPKRPRIPLAEEYEVFMYEVLRSSFVGPKTEGDDLFAEACVPWLHPCAHGDVFRGFRNCLPCGCCPGCSSVECCPHGASEHQVHKHYQEDEESDNHSIQKNPKDFVDSEMYPMWCFAPLHGSARVLISRWFKWLVAFVAVCSLPVMIILAVVLEQSIFMTILIVIQFSVFIFLFPRTCVACLKLYLRLRPYHLLCAVFSVAVTSIVGVLVLLIPYEPLKWSWLSSVELGDDSESENLINFGFKDIVPAIFYTMLILLVLPVAAWFEEVIFRSGTSNWFWALIKSIIFGAIHMTMGVPLIVNFTAMPLMGLWFSREYFEGIRRYTAAEKVRLREAQGVPADWSDSSSDGVLRDVGHPTYTDVRTCSWRPLSIAPFRGHVMPEARNWKIRLHESGTWYYRNSQEKANYLNPPVYARARAAGTRDAALVHLAHNFVAVVLTFVFFMINAIAGTKIDV